MTVTKLWPSTTPGTVDSGDGGSVILGLHFKSSVDGVITGVRFYKASANTGTHIGHLWKASDRSTLGVVTFVGESASGWQEYSFNARIAIVANTEYVVSVMMPAGHYSKDASYFTSAAFVNSPLTAYKSADVSTGNGVYDYSTTSIIIPGSTFGDTNYWVDLIFDDSQTTDGIGTATRIFENGETPASGESSDTGAYNFGIEFYSAVDGTITGVRFWKGVDNTGTHVVNLWTTGGTKLAEKTVSGESASGWQQQLFDTPVAITANTHYIASYVCPNGRYSYDTFGRPFTNNPLNLVNSAYVSGSTPALPNTNNSATYWVDVVFAPAGGGGIPLPIIQQHRQQQGMR